MTLKSLLNKPLWQMTGEEFMFLSKSVTSSTEPRQADVVVDSSSPKYEYGLSGIAQLFGCSIPTANRIKKSGRIDKAIKQIGRKNEKVRVCYLINQLSEKIDKETRSEWIGAMLRITGIEQDYYRSKYREPISDLPSKKNKEFAEALKEILG